MRTRFDQFGKQMVRNALETRGRVETDAEVRPTRAGSSDPTQRSNKDQEFLMDTQDIVEAWRQEAIQEGIAEGVVQGVAQALIEVYEARFGAMPGDVRATVEETHDGPTLRAWVRLVGTRDATEITAAIRASRAS
jgi:flagellar biosynthesis/type III secretory pathway protein FliH